MRAAPAPAGVTLLWTCRTFRLRWQQVALSFPGLRCTQPGGSALAWTYARDALAVAVLVALVAPARAMPGDPPVVPLAPADGAVVGADPAGIGVSFQCPDYRIAVYGNLVQRGDFNDYGVRFSARRSEPTVGWRTRRTATTPPLHARQTGPARRSSTRSTPRARQISGGRVFWQAYPTATAALRSTDRRRPLVGGVAVGERDAAAAGACLRRLSRAVRGRVRREAVWRRGRAAAARGLTGERSRSGLFQLEYTLVCRDAARGPCAVCARSP